MKPALILALGMLFAMPLRAAGEVADIPTRPGVTQRVLLLKPDQPLAVLVMFVGGDSALGIRDDGSLTRGGASLLLRTSPLFTRSGFAVAIVDIPSDQQAMPVANFRESAAHAQDIAAVIAFIRKINNLPVWLIGASSGTTSVLNAAIRLQKNGADGIVLTSSISAEWGGTLMTQLSKIRVPALSVRKSDPCHPENDSSGIMGALKNSAKAEEIAINSVPAAGADSCKTPPTHGYLGLEYQLVDTISGWIKTALRQPDFI